MMPETFTENLLRRFISLVQAGSRGQRSQRSIAKEIGLDHSTLSRWRSGQRMPDAASIDKILAWVEREERADRRAQREMESVS
jgi:transcriptional regulator with XRE-family HTH domain